jgi:hypothetical protein
LFKRELIGYLEKWSLYPNPAWHVKIYSSAYHLYACGKSSARALILNKKSHFSRPSLVKMSFANSALIGIVALLRKIEKDRFF